MADDKFELYVGKSSKLENTVLNIEGQAKIDGLVSGELKTKILHIGEGGKVVGKVDAEHIVVVGLLRCEARRPEVAALARGAWVLLRRQRDAAQDGERPAAAHAHLDGSPQHAQACSSQHAARFASRRTRGRRRQTDRWHFPADADEVAMVISGSPSRSGDQGKPTPLIEHRSIDWLKLDDGAQPGAVLAKG